LRLCASLSRHGLDARQMLADAGISPDLACQTRCRVSNHQMVALLKAARATLNDDFFGLTERALKPGTIHYMFEMGLRCETLEGFIAHCQRFAALLIDDVGIELLHQPGTAMVRIRLRRPELDPDHFLIDQLLLYWHRVMSWAVGYMIPVKRLDLTFDERPNPERLCHWVCKTWVPGQAVSGMHFDSRYLSLPVVRTPLEWQAHFVQANGLPGLPEDEQAWSQRLKTLLQAELKHSRLPSSLNDASGLLGVGARTLRRHLDKEGTSYQQVLDQLLHDEAIEKLHVQRLSVADVAEQLGFAEPRSFSRAFKRWTGVSPTRYSV
jgi:AraC-like DNA-binding protein